ncbi:MAG TPA: sensor domain-containing diguanylate cyclase, partial [Bryobacterales bacterium]|nr:sensor domain-containing diguanylate cyclase [Bryobacterales bacterium]
YDITQALGNSLSVDETLRLLAEQLQKLIHYDAIAIYLIRDGKLIPRFVEGVNAPLLAGAQIPLGEGLSGWVAGTGKPSLNGNPAVEPGYLSDPLQFSKLRCALSVPLDSTKGIIGALTLYSMETESFGVDHLRILKAVGMKAGATIHNALIHEAIGKSAETDVLTGLPNARALWARLEQESARAARQHIPYTVFVVDMNGLKRINDTRGHLLGNKVLKALASAMRGCLREYDLVARMGGDEFVLLLPGMGAEDAAVKRIELAMAVDALNKDFPGLEISISMGSASYPDDSRHTEELMAIADRRMYWHKREFHNSRSPISAAQTA